MYIFLLLIGSVLIVYGTRLRNNDKENILVEEQVFVKEIDMESETDNNIINRLQALEDLVYGLDEEFEDDEIKQDIEAQESQQERSFQEVLDRELHKSPEQAETSSEDYDITEERRKLFEGLEKGQYSMDMVCSILGMEKGEVLLLRNIYNKYQK